MSVEGLNNIWEYFINFYDFMILWLYNDVVVVIVDFDVDVYRICLERWVIFIILRWIEEGEECNYGFFVWMKGKSVLCLIWIFVVSYVKIGFGFFVGYGLFDIVLLVVYVYLVVGIIEWWVFYFEKGGIFFCFCKNIVIIEFGGLFFINFIRE